jgi:hypothetical protein
VMLVLNHFCWNPNAKMALSRSGSNLDEL